MNTHFPYFEKSTIYIDYRNRKVLSDALYEKLNKYYEIEYWPDTMVQYALTNTYNSSVEMLKKDIYRTVGNNHLKLKDKSYTLLEEKEKKVLELFGLEEIKQIKTEKLDKKDILRYLQNGPKLWISVSGWEACYKFPVIKMIEILEKLNSGIDDSVWIRWKFQEEKKIKKEVYTHIHKTIEKLYKGEKVKEKIKQLEMETETQLKDIIIEFIREQVKQETIKLIEPRPY